MAKKYIYERKNLVCVCGFVNLLRSVNAFVMLASMKKVFVSTAVLLKADRLD